MSVDFRNAAAGPAPPCTPLCAPAPVRTRLARQPGGVSYASLATDGADCRPNASANSQADTGRLNR